MALVAAAVAIITASVTGAAFLYPRLFDADPSRLSNQLQIITAFVGLISTAVSLMLWFHARQPSAPSDHRTLLARRVFLLETAALEATLRGVKPLALCMTISSAEGVNHHDVDYDVDALGAALLREPSPRAVLLGGSGAGKTVLCARLILQLAETVRTDATQLRGLVPVRVAAATWTEDSTLADWLATRIEIDYGIPSDAATALVRDRQVMPFIDGLDELDGPVGNQEPDRWPRATSLLQALNEWRYSDDPYPVVVTCRLERYRTLTRGSDSRDPIGLDDAATVTLQPLDPADIRQYVTRRFAHDRTRRAAWEPVLARLEDPSGRVIRLALATPWRLVLATTVVPTAVPPAELLTEGAPHTAGDTVIEQKEADRLADLLLRRFVPAAVKIAVEKTGKAGQQDNAGLLNQRYLRLRAAPDADHVERWLRAIARQQRRLQKDPEAPREGRSHIVAHLLWAVIPPVEMRHIHREWACWLAFLPIAVVIGFFGAAFSLPGYAWVGFGTGLGVGQLARWRCDRLTWPRLHAAAPVKIPFPQVARAVLDGARIGTLPYGLWVGAVAALLHGPVYGLAAGAATMLVCGLMNGIARAMATTSTTWAMDANVASPRRTIQRASRVQLYHWVARASTSMPWWIIIGLPVTIAAGISLAFSFVLFLFTEDGIAVFRYHLGLLVAASHRLLPLRLGRFLEWSTEIGLLRTSGAAYQFRHRELFEWLATEQDDAALDATG